MDEDQRPVLHVIAGPNGAGKTTFYELHLKAMTNAEFVNADLLALEHFGHVATTAAESAMGQALADSRRQRLIKDGRSLVVESTFSHTSKLELLQQAKTAGYRVVVYHLNVRDSEHAVERVRSRVARGGHPVPESRIVARYERNQPIIRDAVLFADLAFVFDSSALGEPPRLLYRFDRGLATRQDVSLPAWAVALYANLTAP